MKKTILFASLLAVSSLSQAEEVMYPNQSSLPEVENSAQSADPFKDAQVNIGNSVTQDVTVEVNGSTVHMDSIVIANYGTPVPNKYSAIQINGITVNDPEMTDFPKIDSLVSSYKLQSNGDFVVKGSIDSKSYGEFALSFKFEDFNNSWALIEEYAPMLASNPDSPETEVFVKKLMGSTKIKEVAINLNNNGALQKALEKTAKEKGITIETAEAEAIANVQSAPQLSQEHKDALIRFMKEKDSLEIKVVANQAMPFPALMMTVMMAQEPEMLLQYFTITLK